MSQLNLFGEAQAAPAYRGLRREADVSECGRYRWSLKRWWEHGGDGRTASVVMLNPSTADGLTDDATIRRLLSFAQRWGVSAIEVRNLFAFRATNPKDLLVAEDPTGGQRADRELRWGACAADLLVVAWGGWVPFGRDREVLKMFGDKPLHCLGTTGDGRPRHPVRLPGDTELVRFDAFKQE